MVLGIVGTCSQGWTPAVRPDWAIFCTLGYFLKPLASINLPKSPTFLGIFCKGVYHLSFSSEIIFGQLLQTFDDFYLVTLLTTHSLQAVVSVLCSFEGMSTRSVSRANNRLCKCIVERKVTINFYRGHSKPKMPKFGWSLLSVKIICPKVINV